MGRELLRMLQGAAVLEISGNPGRTKSMAAGGVGEPGSFGPPLDHVKHVAPYHHLAMLPKRISFQHCIKSSGGPQSAIEGTQSDRPLPRLEIALRVLTKQLSLRSELLD